ncbi:MAG: hypothetical protein IE878_04345 [Epsilonproteobacteria bacterium]|nr:hypothetical protein [Campylobacterota bacterium]MBD3839601.1 hypothetical protein [Campylobacterota bacterium]
MHFSDSDIGLCKRLKEVTIANDYEYKLHILQDSLYESLSQNFEEKIYLFNGQISSVIDILQVRGFMIIFLFLQR